MHSPFRVENLTNQQLEFNVHLFRGPQTPGAPGKGAAAISVVPNNPLAPGQQTYLPVPAIWLDSVAPCMHIPNGPTGMDMPKPYSAPLAALWLAA